MNIPHPDYLESGDKDQRFIILRKSLIFFASLLMGFALIMVISLVMPGNLFSNIATHTANKSSPIFKAPQYSGFINQNGKAVSSKDFTGKFQVVTFLFPLCTSMCPVIAAHMANLEKMIQADGLANKVRVVSFNVGAGMGGTTLQQDAQQGAVFMREYGANPNDRTWQFLTSSKKAMSQVVRKGFHEYFQMISLVAEAKIFTQQKKNSTFNYMPNIQNALANKINPNYDITHSSSIIIVGPDEYIQYIYDDADNVSNTMIIQKIKQLI